MRQITGEVMSAAKDAVEKQALGMIRRIPSVIERTTGVTSDVRNDTLGVCE